MTQRIIVTGPARCGTSVVGNGLASVLQLDEDIDEGHVWPAFLGIQNTITDYLRNQFGRRTRIALLGPAFFSELMRDGIQRAYPGSFLDKTPGLETLRMLPQLIGLWPDLRVIVCIRRGIENVASRSLKWPDVSFEKHCIAWNATMMAWYAIRDQYPNHCLELDQLEIQRTPALSARRIRAHLVLDTRHEQEITQYFTTNHPEATISKTPGARPPHINQVGWSELQRDTFRILADEAMVAFDYVYDETYRKA